MRDLMRRCPMFGTPGPSSAKKHPRRFEKSPEVVPNLSPITPTTQWLTSPKSFHVGVSVSEGISFLFGGGAGAPKKWHTDINMSEHFNAHVVSLRKGQSYGTAMPVLPTKKISRSSIPFTFEGYGNHIGTTEAPAPQVHPSQFFDLDFGATLWSQSYANRSHRTLVFNKYEELGCQHKQWKRQPSSSVLGSSMQPRLRLCFACIQIIRHRSVRLESIYRYVSWECFARPTTCKQR